MVQISRDFQKLLMDRQIDVFSDERLYLVAYQRERIAIPQPWWEFWRKPIVTTIEVQQPDQIECQLDIKSPGRFGNPEITIIPSVIPIPWKEFSKLIVVDAHGTEIAWVEP